MSPESNHPPQSPKYGICKNREKWNAQTRTIRLTRIKLCSEKRTL